MTRARCSTTRVSARAARPSVGNAHGAAQTVGAMSENAYMRAGTIAGRGRNNRVQMTLCWAARPHRSASLYRSVMHTCVCRRVRPSPSSSGGSISAAATERSYRPRRSLRGCRTTARMESTERMPSASWSRSTRATPRPRTSCRSRQRVTRSWSRRQDDIGWWEGSLNGKIGLFPSQLRAARVARGIRGRGRARLHRRRGPPAPTRRRVVRRGALRRMFHTITGRGARASIASGPQ